MVVKEVLNSHIHILTNNPKFGEWLPFIYLSETEKETIDTASSVSFLDHNLEFE